MKKSRVRELWKQGKLAVQGWCSTGNPYRVAAVQRIFAAAHTYGGVACHHGAGLGVSAQCVKMGSKLCQSGNEMQMLTTTTAEALKSIPRRSELSTGSRSTLQAMEEHVCIDGQARADVAEGLATRLRAQGER